MSALQHGMPLSYMMYPKSNLTGYGSAPAWPYPNYPTHHTHHPNNQFFNGPPTPNSAGPNGIIDSESASFYNPHHAMFNPASPDWSAHDSYNLQASNAQFGLTPPASLHLSPTVTSSANTSGDNLQHGLQNIAPSPPNTVSSEMSSPGIGSNGTSGVIGSDETSPMSSGSKMPRSKSPYDWMNKPSYQSQPSTGKTRTKDKYRVVYTDYQRLELEKEYHMSHYITIRRKSELAQSLQLSERQVKIWFQNRRAKDRKQTKKRDGPSNTSNSALLSNGCSNVGLSLQHHHGMGMGMGMSMGNSSIGAGSMYGLDIKPKLEPGLLPPGHPSHNYAHLHQAHPSHPSHPMHHLSMGMNLLHPNNLHHSAASALPPSSISSSPATSIQSQAHLSS